MLHQQVACEVHKVCVVLKFKPIKETREAESLFTTLTVYKSWWLMISPLVFLQSLPFIYCLWITLTLLLLILRMQNWDRVKMFVYLVCSFVIFTVCIKETGLIFNRKPLLFSRWSTVRQKPGDSEHLRRTEDQPEMDSGNTVMNLRGQTEGEQCNSCGPWGAAPRGRLHLT